MKARQTEGLPAKMRCHVDLLARPRWTAGHNGSAIAGSVVIKGNYRSVSVGGSLETTKAVICVGCGVCGHGVYPLLVRVLSG